MTLIVIIGVVYFNQKNLIMELLIYPSNIIYHKTDSGLIIKDSYILDPFWNDEVWIYGSFSKRYFKSNYNLDNSQVWNLVQGLNKDHIHMCNNPECDNQCYFMNLSRGFTKSCCSSCSTSVLNIDNWEAGIFDNSRRVMTPEWYAKRNRTQFMNLGDPTDLCNFYLGLDKDNLLKFGITQDTLREKKKNGKLRTIHHIFSGTRLEVSNFEYKVSLKFKSERLEFNKLKEVIRYIKYLKK